MRKAVLATVLILLVSPLSWAGSIKNKVGTSGAQFLKLGGGARAIGMGGAFAGVADDAQAAFWNPAGLANIFGRELSFSHLSWIADIDHESLVYVQSVSKLGVLAVSAVVLGTEDIEVTTTQQQDGTGETYVYRDLAFGLSYARRLTDKFSFGVSIKYIDEQIYTKHARGFGIDIGTQYRTGFKSLTLSMAVMNFGQDLRFDGTYLNTEVVSGTTTMLFEERKFARLPLPLKFVFGVTYDIFNGRGFRSKLALDALHPNDYAERLHLGLENWFKDYVALRVGYKFNYEQEGFSLGFGIKRRIRDLSVRIDYAYADLGVFDSVDSFSLNLTFEPAKSDGLK